MLSVVIPTYNRSGKLSETLRTLERQILDPKEFEVVVVDDGSTDSTPVILQEFSRQTSLETNFYRQANQGPAQARNLGVKKAKGEIIFFCGDDTFLAENLLAIHLGQHRRVKNIAVLGTVLWDDGQETVNDFMRFLAPAGPQFHYNTIRDRQNAGFDHFYTCNISLERKWFDRDKFSSDFSFAAFEDIDLGMRLQKRGLRIVYEPDARVYHSHHYEPADFYKRAYQMGRSAVILLGKFENDRKTYQLLKRKYAPFMYLGLEKSFHRFSWFWSRSKWLKRMSLGQHWFWSISYHYSGGILYELEKRTKPASGN